MAVTLSHCSVIRKRVRKSVTTDTANFLVSMRTSVCMYHSDLQATDFHEIFYWIF